MNKELLNQLSADEQPVASELTSVAKDMQLSSSFQWELENQLMDMAKTQMHPAQGWHTKIIPTVGWAILALGVLFFLNWTIRSLAPVLPSAAAGTSAPEISFESDVRQGRICTGPLTLAHDFSVFLTNQDKTGFTELDEEKPVDELRTFAWSPDGSRLAIVANQPGRGQVYIQDFGRQLEYVLPISELGYLVNITWSHDGKQLLLQSVKSRSTIYLVKADRAGPIEERSLGAQFFETPQFAPDDKSLVFHGADTFGNPNSIERAGLIQLQLDSLSTRIVGMAPPVQAASSFAWSLDGSRLAYLEVLDNELLRLVVEEVNNGHRVIIASLPNPEGTFGASPINMTWSPDGKNVVFEFGNEIPDRAIYLAHADGTGLVKVADSATAPTISADGRCLAYISNDQVFLMDLTGAASTLPLRVADLPAGRQTATRLDKLQWRP